MGVRFIVVVVVGGAAVVVVDGGGFVPTRVFAAGALSIKSQVTTRLAFRVTISTCLE